MKLAIALTVALLPTAVWAEEWTPPENPDLQAILQEARTDAKKGDYELALAKQVWFHENALKYDQGMTGIRLSFALGYWHNLGEAYPPAMEKLKEVRDETKKRIDAEGKKVSFENFHDLVALNRTLDDESDTVDMFQLVDARDTKAAKKVFGVAEPALIQAKEYALCGKYIDSDNSMNQIMDNYRTGRQFAENPLFGEKLLEFHKKKFLNDASTLVALLVVNDRKSEAENAVREFKKVSGDAEFDAKLTADLDKALEGEVPEPWP